MIPTGSAFLALWNDVEESRDADYNRWHCDEHVPERVSIPGILSGRRYVADDAATHRYFTLYDLDNLETLGTPAYRAVVEQPTAWSRAMRPDLRNFLRQPCRPLVRIGHGPTALAATFRFTVPKTAANQESVVRLLMPSIAQPGIAAARLGLVDVDAVFPIANMTQQPPDDDGNRFVLIIESMDATSLSGSVAGLLPRLQASIGAEDMQAQLYRLVDTVRHDEVDPSLWRHGRAAS